MTRPIRNLLTTAALLGLAGCFEAELGRVITDANGEMGEVVDANTAFALDAYQVIAREEGNVFFSPFSVSAAFGMTLAGTNGDTEAEMMEVLRIDMAEADFHEHFGALIQDLNGDFNRPYTLEIANQLWGQEGWPVQDEFLSVTSDHYGAAMELCDFSADPDGCRNDINSWVEDQTRGRIEDLLPPGSIDGLTRMVLVNAIYFLGDWANAFDPNDTTDGAFTLADGSSVTAPLMTAGFETAEVGWTDGVGVLRLPYDSDEVSMVVLLPESHDGLPDLEAELTPEGLDELLASTEQAVDLQVTLPKFEFTKRVDLVPVLQELGMELAFDCTRADFTGLTDEAHAEGLCITGAFHKAFVSVDEEGTEAAAATAVVVGYESVVEPLAFTADHPFLFLIRDDLTGSILFMGRVADPR
jgi:serpin B